MESADNLILCKVDLPVDDTLESNIDNLKPDHKKALSPVDSMFEVLDTPPQRKHLHIVVQPPLYGQYKGFRYAIAKVKNELGSTATEPHMQTILYYIHSTESFAKAKPTFRFPCITITLFGPHIDFSAAVWSTRPNMQVISTGLPLFHHPTDSKMRAMVARHIGALRKALRFLLACYQGITSPSPDQDLEFLDSKFQDPMFPYPYSFTCIETSLT
ncbi:uncharacterized protein HD556DRAFT_1446190 [Suillus plorans]|uniref:Uncharacterized protein n=1 Tax=Suillus plorans TaxID=116603 RepID=A0A9P7DF84_9AGAM|nr:uncharacterized protein HD556DRAFT_1446190 [Suillus plorans]KAG1790463.1 hypothetical protein HD556DRAFT_1446190 [Suillus plorans]